VVNAEQRQSLDQIIEALQSSPLFQLSLASKELFHSNFLAWLATRYPQEVGQLFAEFVRTRPADCSGLRVYRERENIDLTLRYPHGETLIIENKVKSLPNRLQMSEYTGAARDESSTSFLLLSLTTPTFLDNGSQTITLDDGAVWQFLNYGELAGKLAKLQEYIGSANDYHRHLLADYCAFIRNLDRLQALFSIDWNDRDSNFFDTEDEVQHLRAVRLHDLVDKIRYAQLGHATGERLAALGFDVVQPVQWPARVGQVALSSGMTRGTGLFDLKYLVIDSARFGSPVMLGVQIQGNAFRLVLECWDKGKARVIAEHLLRPKNRQKLWFDFTPLAAGSAEYPKKGDFNQYGGTFLYRSRTLPPISPAALVDLIAAYAEVIRSNEDAIWKQVEGVLVS